MIEWPKAYARSSGAVNTRPAHHRYATHASARRLPPDTRTAPGTQVGRRVAVPPRRLDRGRPPYPRLPAVAAAGAAAPGRESATGHPAISPQIASTPSSAGSSSSRG